MTMGEFGDEPEKKNIFEIIGEIYQNKFYRDFSAGCNQ